MVRNFTSEKQNQAILNAVNATVPAGILVVRVEDGEIVLANAEAHRILGAGVTEIFGDAWGQMFVSSEDRQEILVQFTSAGELRDYEVEIVLPDGEPAWLMISMTGVDSAEDDLLVMTLIEITGVKLLQTEAQKSSLAKTRFLSNMSHELRTPLNAVLGFSQLLEGDPDQPLTKDQAECVNLIWRSGRHLLKLVDDVLDLIVIEDGDLKVFLDPADARQLLEDCQQLISEKAEDASVTVMLEEIPDVPVLGDAKRLRQIFMNLLSNAVKYNRPEGQVVITGAVSADNMMEISFTDSGEGIDDEHLHSLFERFSKLDYKNSDAEGIGVGLIMAKKLIEAMSGHLDVASAVGEGSTFTVSIPLAATGD
jgi:PAS domain S-box-containing protein